LDGFVKSPSAALRFNFVVAAHFVSALHSSVFTRLASGAFYETIVLVTFCEIINFGWNGKFTAGGSFSPLPFSSNRTRIFSHLTILHIFANLHPESDADSPC
jgi:hypothetical protein